MSQTIPPVKPALASVAPTPFAAPVRPAAVRPQAPPTYAALSPGSGRRRVLAAGVVALHVLVLWGLSQVQDVRRTVARVAPVMVRLIAPAEPPKPLSRTPVPMPTLQAPAPTFTAAARTASTDTLNLNRLYAKWFFPCTISGEALE